jgi:hypothetical protein
MNSPAIDNVDVAALRNSPIHDLRPISPTPSLIDIDAIEEDETNPGTVTESLRYKRREPSIRDSFDIIGSIVYPIIVCQHPEVKKRQLKHYLNIDGHGRLYQARRRDAKQIYALIYPPLTLEQRICLRQTLGAAQESFDAVSVMHDLRILAAERKLDLKNADDVAVLIRDLPEKVRRYEEDFNMLARWDLPDTIILGESYKKDSNVIGLEKIRGLTKIVDAVKTNHPTLYKSLGEDRGITSKLAKMYVDKKFSVGTRSQEAIRKVTSAIKELPENDPIVRRFFSEELDHAVLTPYAKTRSRTPKDIVSACEPLIAILLTADTTDLSDQEKRALGRINSIILQLLTVPTQT